MSADRSQAAAGVLHVRALLAEWQELRAEMRALEEAEHPPFLDKFGREWTWWKGDLWHHDNTSACTRDMIDRIATLPPERLRDNPNYHKLCGICRSQWSDKSPVSPRCLLAGGWYDVRDGLLYAEPTGLHMAEDAAQLAAWETDGGR